MGVAAQPWPHQYCRACQLFLLDLEVVVVVLGWLKSSGRNDFCWD